MSRSIWKGNFMANFFFREKPKKKNIQKIWARSSCIPYSFLNKSVLIHTGKVFKKIFITRHKIGFKFGEFCFTRVAKKKVEKKQIKNAVKKR